LIRSDRPARIRKATEDDVARIGAIAHAAYVKYVSRIGREPAPMRADFAAEIAADHVVVIETAGAVDGYMIAWPEADAYFIDNIAVDPARQGEGLGRQLIDQAVEEGRRLRFGGPAALHQCGDDGESTDVRPSRVRRNASCDRERLPPRLSASDLG
jgi:ribosomal protein S18 acetylase RimI-like enzyme